MQFEKYGTVYTIAVTLAIMITYLVASSLAVVSFGYSEGALIGLRMAFSQFIIILLPTVYLSNRQGLKFTDFFSINSLNWKFLGISVIGFLGFLLFSSGYISLQAFFVPDSLVPQYKELERELMSRYKTAFIGSGNWEFFVALLSGAIAPAICLEYLFRGYLLSNLNRTNGYFNAILISGIIFSITHLNPIQFAPLTAFGIYLGFVAYYSKSLVLPVILNFTYNAFGVLAFYYEPFASIDKHTTTIPIPIAGAMTLGGALLLIYSLTNMKPGNKETIEHIL